VDIIEVALGINVIVLGERTEILVVTGVLAHEPVPVKVIVAVPADTPVTNPVLGLIVATLAGLILHAPGASTGLVEKSEVPEIHNFP
jgi:hypothetical protein